MAGSGREEQHVGPFKLEKTLGKGQTGTLTFQSGDTGGAVLVTTAIMPVVCVHSASSLPNDSTLPMVAGLRPYIWYPVIRWCSDRLMQSL